MNKTALITGGSRGIGLGICKELIKKGFSIAFCGMRQKEDILETIHELESLGAQVLYCQADISNSAQRAKMLSDIQKTFGALDVLVNNAGKAPKVRADILEADEDSFEDIIKVNLQGPYFLTKEVANMMIAGKKKGTIINVSSISSTVASVNRGDYCISKAGLSMSTQLWAARLGEFGIDVFEIRPGIIETDMTSGVKEKYDKMIEDGLLLQKRWGKSEDIGKIAATMASGELPYSTGQVITADGGMTLQRL